MKAFLIFLKIINIRTGQNNVLNVSAYISLWRCNKRTRRQLFYKKTAKICEVIWNCCVPLAEMSWGVTCILWGSRGYYNAWRSFWIFPDRFFPSKYHPTGFNFQGILNEKKITTFLCVATFAVFLNSWLLIILGAQLPSGCQSSLDLSGVRTHFIATKGRS